MTVIRNSSYIHCDIDQPPAHDTVDRRDRAAPDHPHSRLVLHIIEPRGLTSRLAVDQSNRPKSIELDDPVPNDLRRHAAKLRWLGAGRPIVNGRQRQKPPSLRTILRSFGRGPYQTGIKSDRSGIGMANLLRSPC